MEIRTSDLLPALGAARGIGDVPARVVTLTDDSRAVVPGACFIAVRGARSDGHEHAAAAVRAGATLLIVERALPLDVPQLIVDDTTTILSPLAARAYGDPSTSLTVVGITGTNGKTTTTHLLAAICAAASRPCAIVGTLGVRFGALSRPSTHTTLPALELHALLATLREAGAAVVAMEVSSHALAQGRVADVRFAVGALTNVTRDHLDFHATPEAYAAAKRRLFVQARASVLNVDDAVGARFATEFSDALTYAVDGPARLRATDVALRADGCVFTLDGRTFSLPLPGAFNVANALAAIGVARTLGIDDATSARGLAAVAAVPGRMERIGAQGIDVVIDYAHTPDALERVLRALRRSTRGRLSVVFGCGGDRDAGKRALMGALAATLADTVIVTSDNPRGEDPARIARDIVGDTGARVILDRRAAIGAAIESARTGDVVLIAGKGHETRQIIGNESFPFDDRDEARAALARRTVTVV